MNLSQNTARRKSAKGIEPKEDPMSNNVVKTLKQKIKARLKKISKHQSKLKALEKKLKKRK